MSVTALIWLCIRKSVRRQVQSIVELQSPFGKCRADLSLITHTVLLQCSLIWHTDSCASGTHVSDIFLDVPMETLWHVCWSRVPPQPKQSDTQALLTV